MKITEFKEKFKVGDVIIDSNEENPLRYKITYISNLRVFLAICLDLDRKYENPDDRDLNKDYEENFNQSFPYWEHYQEEKPKEEPYKCFYIEHDDHYINVKYVTRMFFKSLSDANKYIDDRDLAVRAYTPEEFREINGQSVY